MFEKSAYDLWKIERMTKPIITLCKEFDNAIGGGVHIGAITEFVGGPGTGKTQLCLQLCVNVQIPADLCGLEGAAIFIETNCGFTVNRIKQIATASYNHCKFIYQSHNLAHDPSAFNVDTILNNIHFISCNNHLELLATIYSLTDLLTNNSKIRLVVIDSFSYLFRSIKDDENVNRVQMLYEALTELQNFANTFKCAIVLTNELTTRFTSENETELMPALGDSHTHRVNVQITLGRDVNDRELFAANIDKCFYGAEKKVTFLITGNGMRPIRKKRPRNESS